MLLVDMLLADICKVVGFFSDFGMMKVLSSVSHSSFVFSSWLSLLHGVFVESI